MGKATVIVNEVVKKRKGNDGKEVEEDGGLEELQNEQTNEVLEEDRLEEYVNIGERAIDDINSEMKTITQQQQTIKKERGRMRRRLKTLKTEREKFEVENLKGEIVS